MNVHELIVPKCVGCNKINGDICVAYLKPASRHRICNCPLRSTKALEVIKDNKIKVNPIKASKRGGK